jgi:hypothetical protein
VASVVGCVVKAWAISFLLLALPQFGSVPLAETRPRAWRWRKTHDKFACQVTDAKDFVKVTRREFVAVDCWLSGNRVPNMKLIGMTEVLPFPSACELKVPSPN